VQTNSLTSYIDANFVYGSSPTLAAKLREYRGGCLKVLPQFKDLGLKPLLPLKTEQPDDGCIRPHRDLYCFLAGESAVALGLFSFQETFGNRNPMVRHLGFQYRPHFSFQKGSCSSVPESFST
jgi:Animal haem peroxidase.